MRVCCAIRSPRMLFRACDGRALQMHVALLQLCARVRDAAQLKCFTFRMPPKILQSPELGLQLTEEELAVIHLQLVSEPSGLISYVAWSPQAAAIIASAHQDSSDPSVSTHPP